MNAKQVSRPRVRESYSPWVFVTAFVALLAGMPVPAAAQAEQRPSQIEGPVVRSPVTPQVLQEDLNAVTRRKRAPQWRPGDPVIIIEDMKERLQPAGRDREGKNEGKKKLQGAPADQREEHACRRSRLVRQLRRLRRRGGAKHAVEPPEAATCGSATSPGKLRGHSRNRLLAARYGGSHRPNHYVQAVNTAFAVYDKAGNLLVGPLPINALWAGFGGACEKQNNGDPIVRYDHLADRWLISQFALPGPDLHQCVAISRTGDPVAGGWFLYDFPTIDTASGAFVFPDYPKIGVWPDAYYMGTQRGFPNGGLDVWAFDRDRMLAGLPAGQIQFHVRAPSLFLMPSDLNGPPPPAKTPNTFARHVDGQRFGGADRLELFDFHVDWMNPASSTFNLSGTLPTAPFDTVLCEVDTDGTLHSAAGDRHPPGNR